MAGPSVGRARPSIKRSSTPTMARRPEAESEAKGKEAKNESEAKNKEAKNEGD